MNLAGCLEEIRYFRSALVYDDTLWGNNSNPIYHSLLNQMHMLILIHIDHVDIPRQEYDT